MPTTSPSPAAPDRLTTAEDLLVAALLAQCGYARSVWALDWAVGLAQAEPRMSPSLQRQDHDGLARACFVRATMSPLNAADLGLPSTGEVNGQAFSLRAGQWRHGHLGEGLVTVEQRGDRRIVHLAFRGTEPDSDPDGLTSMKRLFLDYGMRTYPNIKNHFPCFEPLAEAVVAFVNDPIHGVDELHVSGHSLGGACVERFFLAHAHGLTVPVKGFTFGSPGSVGWWERAKTWARGWRTAPEGTSVPPAADAWPIQRRYHPADPVPRAGTVLYQALGQAQPLLTSDERELFAFSGDTRVHGVAAHSMVRYARAAEDELVDLMEDLACPDAPVALQALRAARLEALELEAGVPLDTLPVRAIAAAHAEALALATVEGPNGLAARRARWQAQATLEEPEKAAGRRRVHTLATRLRTLG